MIGQLKPYLTTRSSGVELGEIPAHWELRQLGRIGRLSKGGGGTKDDEVPEGVPCIRYGDLYMHHEFFITHATSFISQERVSDYTAIQHGDILFAGSGETIDEIGKSAVNLLDRPSCCGGDVIVWRPLIEIDPRFMGYATACWPAAFQKSRMGRGITVMHIYGDDLKYMWVALPPASEQLAIVRFLDYADRRIRRFIRAKQKLIALLAEQKQAIIQRAVTRGVDLNARLKPSGVEWLGDVPEHWEVVRSKRIFMPRTEFARPNDIQLSATQAYGVIAQEEYERKVGRKIVKILHHLDKRRHVEVDDFVISMRSFQGGLERAWTTGCIRSSYIVLRAATRLDVGFFSYLFKSQSYIRALQATANFIRDGQDLNFDNFCAVDLPFPPVEEQRQIAGHLDDFLAETATLAERARVEIDLLKEYRTRLIADVVTGKLDVREAAPPLQEDAYDDGSSDVLGLVDEGAHDASVPEEFAEEAHV